MNELISKWADYCEGGTRYDDSDFLGLLAQKWGDDDLNEIFRQVPLSGPVLDNLKRIYRSTEDEPHVYLRPKAENAATSDELKAIILGFIDCQRRCLLKRKIDEETRAWLERSDLEVSLVSSEQLRTSVDPNDDIRPFILQEEAELRKYRPETGLNFTTADSIEYRVMSGIEEALYGLACDYHLAWYVLSPLVNSEIDYDIYFEFWRKGGKYALTDSQILIASIWNEGNAGGPGCLQPGSRSDKR